MNRILKIIAIVMLVVTLAAVGAVVYGVMNFVPKVVQVQSSVIPAAQAQEQFDAALSQMDNGTFTGRLFGDVSGVNAADCSFVAYSVRLKNDGFFPAEWITLCAVPISDQTGCDVLQLESGGANVLSPGTQGDLACTVLTSMTAPQQPRAIQIECYVFGRRQVFSVDVQ